MVNKIYEIFLKRQGFFIKIAGKLLKFDVTPQKLLQFRGSCRFLRCKRAVSRDVG